MASNTDMSPWRLSPSQPGDTHHYLAFSDHISRQIHCGVLPAGAKLPSERQLQDSAGISRGTIREALFQLEAEGLIYRRDRSGWYVCPKAVVYDPTRWAGFMTYVAEQGRKPETQTLSVERAIAGAAAVSLGVEEASPVYRILRRRLVDGRPVLVERILVDAALAPNLMDYSLNGSLTRILKDEFGVAVARNIVEMRPCALVREEAAALGVKSGTPGLLVVRTSLDARGRVVEFDHEYWRHDAVRICVDTVVGEG